MIPPQVPSIEFNFCSPSERHFGQLRLFAFVPGREGCGADQMGEALCLENISFSSFSGLRWDANIGLGKS